MSNEMNGLMIIESTSIQSMQGSLAKIKEFQEIVRSQFVQGRDYGIIPGTGSKPTMLKPGAEKLIMLLGLSSTYEIVESTRDFDKGFFQYQIKCTLKKGDLVITEGIGAANTKERKYVRADSFTMDNTVLKMAKKRAMVDAALLVGALSDIYTQDIEDMDLEGNQASTYNKYATDQDGNISRAQAKRMFGIAKGDADVVKAVLRKYGYKASSDEVKKTDYNTICSEIENMIKETTQSDLDEFDLPWSNEDVNTGDDEESEK